ncbi:MAG: Coenzyme F420 hydrogenase/dehydrogenase, beta subunit C-terminal domain [Bacteroidaceae bacterium]|nr:Coenzyme F420 hydrogenase/dehydrogenase, beta subunit C-terminal domain [Bacteroidaceae bacterium]
MKLAKKKDCTACMACIDSCSHQALSSSIDPDGYYQIDFDTNKCVECGLCTRTCPVLSPPRKSIEESRPYAAWNTHQNLRKKSASGGAFSAIASAILQERGVVYGAAIEGFEIRHKRIERIEDLPPLLGSKYQQSIMNGVYKSIIQDLKNGRIVLFCGMACQVAGLKAVLGKCNTENLYTIDTICGGLSTMLPMLQLKQSGRYTGIVSFRDKENGWQSKGFRYALKMQKTDGSVENLGLDNLVLNTFSSKLLKRSSCLDCQFTGNNRYSDCTIGDFWGDDKFKDQHCEGLSILVTHNERIFPLLKRTNISITPIRFHDFIHGNHNYYWTHYPQIRHFFSRKRALAAMRQGKSNIAAHLMRPNSMAGIYMRIYLKLNFLLRKSFMLKFLKTQKYV